MAHCGEVSQLIWVRPTASRPALTMPDSLLSIHAQIDAETSRGSSQGTRNSARSVADEREPLEEEDREREADRVLEHDRDEREHRGVDERRRERRALDDLDVVVEPDERRGAVDERPEGVVAEAQVEVPVERDTRRRRRGRSTTGAMNAQAVSWPRSRAVELRVADAGLRGAWRAEEAASIRDAASPAITSTGVSAAMTVCVRSSDFSFEDLCVRCLRWAEPTAASRSPRPELPAARRPAWPSRSGRSAWRCRAARR